MDSWQANTAATAKASPTKSKIDASTGDAKPPASISDTDASSEQKNFAEKLLELLDTPELQEIFHWVPSGEAFCITDQKAFESKIMAKHFPTAKFESFARRMRRWGFHRVESTDQRNRGIIMFMCPRFRKGRPDLCKAMCDDRQLKKKSGGSGGGSPSKIAPSKASGDEQLTTKIYQTQAGLIHPGLVQTSVMSNLPIPYINPATMGYVVPAPANISPALALQQASQNNATQSFVSAYNLTGSTLPTNLTSNISLAPTTAFNLLTQANLLQFPAPTTNSRGDLVNIQANIYQVEAELAVISRMKEMKRQSLTLAAARAAKGHNGPSLPPGQGSPAPTLF